MFVQIKKLQKCKTALTSKYSTLLCCCDVYVQGHGLGGVACILIFFVHSEEQFFVGVISLYYTFHKRSHWPQTLSCKCKCLPNFPTLSENSTDTFKKSTATLKYPPTLLKISFKDNIQDAILSTRCHIFDQICDEETLKRIKSWKEPTLKSAAILWEQM